MFGIQKLNAITNKKTKHIETYAKSGQETAGCTIQLFKPAFDTPTVRKPGFSDLEKHDIQSISNTSPFFAVARALKLHATMPCH